MNAGKHIYDLLIAQSMKRWHDLVRTPIINRKVPTSYARRQFRTLLRKYPLVAARYGFTEESVIILPPRVLECELLPNAADPASGPTGLGLGQHLSPSSPVASAPPQEFPINSLNADVTDSAPAERLVDQIAGCLPEQSASGVPSSLEGEVL
jgi:hypothetical protein